VPQPAPAQPGAPLQGVQPQSTDQAAVTRANAELVVTLTRTALVAVHQANVTGNYTVLRDLGAPDFRDRNSAADLAAIFASIRQLKIDLSVAVLLDPQISQATMTDRNLLHVVGALATKPVPVRFELLFQPLAGTWRIYGVAIVPVQGEGAPAAPLAVQSAPQGAASSKPARNPSSANARRPPPPGKSPKRRPPRPPAAAGADPAGAAEDGS
jgi:hypothetical protein